MPVRRGAVAIINAWYLAVSGAACTGGTAGSLPDAGPAPLPPEVVIDGPSQLAVGGHAVFRVQARRKGKPVPAEPVRVRTETGATVFAGVTSADGACDVRFKVEQVAKEGDEETHLVFQVGTPPSRSETSRSLAVKSAWRPMLEIDHRRALPGDTVQARLTVIHPDRMVGMPDVKASLEFRAPGGVLVHRAEGTTDAGGLFAASLPLESETLWGPWTVKAKAGETVEGGFMVIPPPSGEAPAKPPPRPRRKPPAKVYDVLLRPVAGILAGGLDNPLLALVTFAGEPAPGVDVTVRHGSTKGAGRTGENGEAWMSLPIPDGGAPVRLQVRLSVKKTRKLERDIVLPRHPGGGGLVVRPAFAVAPPGQSIKVQVDGPQEGQAVVDAWRRGRLVATMSAALVQGKAVVDADPAVLGHGLVWFIGRLTGKGAGGSWGGAPTFVPPIGALDVRPSLKAKSYVSGDLAKVDLAVEDDMAKPTAARLSGVVREVIDDHDAGGGVALRVASHRLARRLLDGLPDRGHPAGDLHALVAASLAGTVPDKDQAVARMHLAGLRYDNAPGPWPVLSAAVTGKSGAREEHAPRAIEPESATPDTVVAFPGDLQGEASAPATLELQTRDQSGSLAGAVVALEEGRLGLKAIDLPIEREFEARAWPPVAVSANDVVSIPVTVKNHTRRKLAVTVRLALADWFELSDVQQTRVKPAPGGEETAWFRVTVRQVGRHEVSVLAKTDNTRKTVKATMDVVPDGKPFEVVRAGILSEAATVVKFTLPPVTKDVPEKAYLTFDPRRDRVLSRALDAVMARPRPELISEGAATRVAARIAVLDGAEFTKLKRRAAALLAPQYQRLLRFRRVDGGWSVWRDGPADDDAAVVAANTLKLLEEAGIVGATEALVGLPKPEEAEDAGEEQELRQASLRSILQSREGDAGWGSLLDTEEAVAGLIPAAPLQTEPVEFFVEMDGKPLLNKKLFDPAGPVLRVDLPDRIGPGPHFVRIVLPREDVGIPWTLLVRSSVRWPKKPEPAIGWKVKLKGSKKAKRKGKGSLKLALTRTEEAEPGPLVVRLVMPPGVLPIRKDLEAAVAAERLAGYALAPGRADLFFNTETDGQPIGSLAVGFGFVATTPGRFHTPPTALWTLTEPGIVDWVRGPKLAVR